LLDLLDDLQHHDNWLVGYDSHLILQLVLNRCQQLRGSTTSAMPLRVLVAERDSIQFLVGFLAACVEGCHIFLGNPDWGDREWQDVFQIVQPDVILGQGIKHYPWDSTAYSQTLAPYPTPLILIPTGGTSGKIRFTIHTWDALASSVQGFLQHFQQQRANCYCVLPLYHVSGLMQALRSLISGGQLALGSLKAIESGQLSALQQHFLISLVPTQLQRLLAKPDTSAWISDFQAVLLGGAPPWPTLLEQARIFGVPLALTYGMTETASQVATLRPEEFMAGNNSCGQVLPHARITIRDTQGHLQEVNQAGIIYIRAQSLTLGYYPDLQHQNILLSKPNSSVFRTDDLGYLDPQGNLHVIGRQSEKIITGGENVFPSEVEFAIHNTGLVADIYVLGIPDPEWGQAVSAIYVPRKARVRPEQLKAALQGQLSTYKIPKHWIAVERLPRNAQGKLNRHLLMEMINQRLAGPTS
jgi:O-succinylbenzoic acid--CoA ligase